MIIGIDANEANVERKVGISEVAYNTLDQFSRINAEKVNPANSFNIYLKEKPREDMPTPTTFWKYNIFGPAKLWTQFALPINLYTHFPHPDVFFSLTHYAPRFSPVPTVVSVMDLAYLYFPQLFKPSDLYQLKSWTAYSVKKAAKVITISNSSKNDIIKEYNIPEKNVAVIYPGIKPIIALTPHIYSMNELKSKYGLSENFLLFVGTLQPRKNITRLIESFAKVVADEKAPPDLQLVIVGKKGWLYEEILTTPAKLEITEKVKFLDFVSDDDLNILYQHAICYILPSLYEGFGLPVLEAMKHDCPVITSNTSSLPEAGGDAALYVDPKDTNDIAAKIMKLVMHKELRKELIAKGKKQLTKFSWEKTAKETLQILEEVAQTGKK
jgi:glycosyltransferase involved in cell wall biosynthesis